MKRSNLSFALICVVLAAGSCGPSGSDNPPKDQGTTKPIEKPGRTILSGGKEPVIEVLPTTFTSGTASTVLAATVWSGINLPANATSYQFFYWISTYPVPTTLPPVPGPGPTPAPSPSSTPVLATDNSVTANWVPAAVTSSTNLGVDPVAPGTGVTTNPSQIAITIPANAADAAYLISGECQVTLSTGGTKTYHLTPATLTNSQ